MHLPGLLRTPVLSHYGAAGFSILTAIVVRMLLDPVLGDAAPFVTFVIAVLLTILYASPGASLMALALALLSARYFFIAPRYAFSGVHPSDLLAIGLYGAIGVVAIVLIHAQRRAQRRVETNAQDAIHKQRALEQEIRQRQRAEEALRESEERFRTAFAQATVGMALTDRHGRFLKVNRAYCGITGYTEQDLYERDFPSTIHPDDLAGNRESIRQLLAGDMTSFVAQTRHVTKSGGLVWVQNSIAGLRSDKGEGVNFVILSEDISDRRRTEEELRVSQARLQAVLDNSPAMIFIKDLDGRYLLSNRQFEKITGVPGAQVIGKTDYDLFRPEQAAAFRANDLEVLKAGAPMEFEEAALHNDGIHTSIVCKFPLRDSDGKPYAVCGITTDITARKQLEEQLRQAQKMEAIGRLAGGIAHDFNNLLMVIIGYCRLLLQQVVRDPLMQNRIEEILRAGERATTLTRQLLAFSRKQVLTPTVLDLNTVLSEMSSMLQRLLGEDINLATALDPALGHVKTDQGQIEQVIMNLAVNARDAMPRGGRLTIETRNVELREATRQNQSVRVGHYVLLSVSDTGEGMDAATQERIFEPFFTTKEQGKGTGLGLATVYGIVKQSGGYIFVYSERGRGTTFKLYLPRVDEPVASASLGPVEAGLPRGTETVLLVEDEPGVRSFVRNILQQYGYTVLEARHGFEALVIAHQHPASIHLLLTDVVMPQMSGPEVAAHLIPLRPDLKVLYMSGYSDEAVIHHGVMAPATAFLQKPCGPDTLVRKVREVLDRVNQS